MYYLSVEMRNLPLNTYVTCSGLHKLSMAEVGFELCVFDIEVLFYSWHKFQHWEGQLVQTLSHSALLYPDTSDNGADYLSGQFMTFFLMMPLILTVIFRVGPNLVTITYPSSTP